jgi:NADPH-dependent 2,4-dienoyl-CoA reductase/sulfur reductase-like enzyme/nitrite reductase/ring-hydroxylating ferredoxin subunit
MGTPNLPDLRSGIDIRELADDAIVSGRVESEEVILIRRGATYFAVGALCSHYHGALAGGLIVDDTIRCPLHHACFSLRSGQALRAPALDPISCWRVERIADRVFVREKVEPGPASFKSAANSAQPSSVVIVGGGGAGLAAADMLRREGYAAPVTLVSADPSAPCDRPNLSKDFLAGNAPPEWIPLRTPDYYAQQRIDLLLDTPVAALDINRKRVQLAGGRQLDYGALLLATGADPVHLDIPGSSPMPRFYLRSFADSQAIVNAAAAAKRALIVGASFIGLEVAAALRQRGLQVHVVGPERIPLERVLGPEIGSHVGDLHRSHGVVLHLGASLARVDGTRATLSDGTAVDADFMVLGVGVRPAVALAEAAGLAVDRGISVNEYLETSASGVFAAGDAVRWPDPRTGNRIRVEHWVVAERQGQVAALNMLGRKQRYDAVPFFWSQHYDVAINYVGHAETWDALAIDGSPAASDCTATYRQGGRVVAVATISRDLQSLLAERDLEVMKASTP